MKWQIGSILMAALVAWVLHDRWGAFLVLATVCGGIFLEKYQEKTEGTNEDDHSMFTGLGMFTLCCLVAFVSGVVWGYFQGYGLWSILIGFGYMILFFFMSMVTALDKKKAI